MKEITRLLILTILSTFVLNTTKATHNMGGTISYTCIAPQVYTVDLTLYGDCNGVFLPTGATINLSSPSCGSFTASLPLLPNSPQDITPICATDSTKCNSNPTHSYGINKYQYKGNVTLPTAGCSDWEISWSSCCRIGSITTLQNPGSTGMYIYAKLNDALSSCNSSPYFADDPRFFLASNDSNVISHQAIDIDGDSLVYSLIAPLQSGSNSVNYQGGLSNTIPFIGSSVALDPQTGQLTVIPTALQVAVVSIRVEEFRNGIKIGEIINDVQYSVLNTTNDLPKISGINNVNGNFTQSAQVGVPLQFTIPSDDAEANAGTQSVSMTWSNNITNASFNVSGQSPIGTFTWIPTLGDTGKHYFTVYLDDGSCVIKGMNSYTFTIDVDVPLGMISDCDKLPDVLYVTSTSCASNWERCIDIPYQTIGNYQIFSDNQAYTNALEPCDIAPAVVYPLIDSGSTMTVNFHINGAFYLPFTTNKLSDIADSLNVLFPNDDWYFSNDTLIGRDRISPPNLLYVEVWITYIGGTQVINLPTQTTAAFGTKLHLTGTESMLTITEIDSNVCVETAPIQFVCLSNSIVVDTILVGASSIICADTIELYSDITSVFVAGDTASNVIVDSTDLNGCIFVTATQGGTDVMSVVVCDEFGICDTTNIILVTIQQTLSHAIIADTVAAGTTNSICLNKSGIVGTLSNIQLIGSPPNNATITSINQNTACFSFTADSIAIDTFQFEICGTLGVCDTNTVILNVQLGVWAGDTDTNTVVDNFDLLNLGLGYGTTGTPRVNPSIVWDGYIADDWGISTPVSNIDYKHLDCNGDGIINASDTTAIILNWGNSYNYNKNGLGGNTLLSIDTRVAVDTEHISLPIILGSMSMPANNVYGLAFTVIYDTALIKPNTAHFDFSNSWIGTIANDMISIEKDFYNDGRISGAVTRIDGMNSNGFGQIGTLNLTIQDDILQKGFPKKYFQFKVTAIKMIDNAENEILVSGGADTLKVKTQPIPRIDHLLTIYPNPAQNQLTIESNQLQILGIQLLDLNGRTIVENQTNTTNEQMDVSKLPNGIYILTVKTDKGRINKKVSILR